MTTAHTLTEQIEKRGAQSWVDPLIEDMGEWLLIQLGDMANLMEVMLKYDAISFVIDCNRPQADCDITASTSGESLGVLHGRLSGSALAAWPST